MTNNSNTAARLVDHLGRYRDDAWTPHIRRRAQLCLLDSLACFSAGRTLRHHAPSAQVAGLLFGAGPQGGPTSPFLMAYLYGQAANALDYDDTLLGHPGAPVIGAVLAVAARAGLGADQVLRGIAAGHEVHWVLAAAAIPTRDRAAQVRSVGVWDTLAGCLGAGVALGLDDAVLERAIGVAVSHSLLPYTGKWYERPVPGMKNNLGWAAAGAVLSLDLALAGQTGVTDALDGDTGMWRMAGSDRWEFDRSLAGKAAMERVAFKPYPVCWHMQEYLKRFDGLLSCIAADDTIAAVTLTGPPEIEKFCRAALSGPADIAFSLPAAFSLMIEGIVPGPRWDSFDDDAHELRHRELFQYRQSERRMLAIRTRSGRTMEADVDTSDFSDPAAWGLDEAGVLDKHRRLAAAPLQNAAAAFLASDAAAPDGGFYAVMSACTTEAKS
jgi:2-methylcitrate dehydratase PrpD